MTLTWRTLRDYALRLVTYLAALISACAIGLFLASFTAWAIHAVAPSFAATYGGFIGWALVIPGMLLIAALFLIGARWRKDWLWRRFWIRVG